MTLDYDKLINLGYTAYEDSQDLRSKLDENEIEYPVIEVEKDYEDDTPVVEVRAEDHVEGTVYTDRYQLENVTEEEFEEVMFDIWRDAMEELEQY